MKTGWKRMLWGMLAGVVLSAGLMVSAGAAFRDVPAKHWAAESISRCVKQGVFQGRSADHFGLGDTMARGSFAVVLCRFFGWETDAWQGTYTDVPEGAWYAGAVESAYRHGAFTLQNKHFAPEDPITREEITVALTRALGYEVLAGLAQEHPAPFTDVTTNKGYITVAYELGLMNGTTATTFGPRGVATREQVAVIMMRLYDRLHVKQGVFTPLGKTAGTELTGCAVTAVDSRRLISSGGEPRLLASGMQASVLTQQRGEAQRAGAKQLLTVTGTEAALRAGAGTTAALLAQNVNAGGYDGVYLDLGEISAAGRSNFTALTQALRKELGGKLLYVAVNASDVAADAGGYDWAALGTACDKLVVRLPAYRQEVSGMTVAPPDRLEDVYRELAALKQMVDAKHLSLQITTGAQVWCGGRVVDEITAAQAQQLAQSEPQKAFYHARYDCACYTGTYQGRGGCTIWYLNRQAVEKRMQLAAMLGLEEVCVSDWAGMPG